MKQNILVTAITLVIGLTFLFVGVAYSASVTLTWDAVTQNTDNTPITDLAGYRVFMSNTSGSYCRTGLSPQYDFTACDNTNMRETVAPPYIWTNLTGGTYFFVVSAHNTSGNHSVLSDEIQIVIYIIPETPTNFRVP